MQKSLLTEFKQKQGIIVYNPVAGAHRAKKVAQKLQEKIGLDSENLYRTTDSGAVKRAKKIVARTRPEFIIVIAGDGTINKYANAVLHSKNPDCLLAIKSAGSGNDFAYSLPRKEEKLKVDIGYIKEKDYHFVNCLDVGFAAKVANKASERLQDIRSIPFVPNYLKPHWAYLKAALTTMGSYGGQNYSVTLAEKKSKIKKEGNFLMIGSLNGKREGKIFKAAPDASLTDGYLSVNLIEDVPSIKRIDCLLRAIKGRHRDLNYVDYRKVKRIKIASKKKFPIQADGEKLKPEKKITIQVKKKKLRVVKI